LRPPGAEKSAGVTCVLAGLTERDRRVPAFASRPALISTRGSTVRELHERLSGRREVDRAQAQEESQAGIDTDGDTQDIAAAAPGCIAFGSHRAVTTARDG
jgi:hypothetical protein